MAVGFSFELGLEDDGKSTELLEIIKDHAPPTPLSVSQSSTRGVGEGAAPVLVSDSFFRALHVTEGEGHK